MSNLNSQEAQTGQQTATEIQKCIQWLTSLGCPALPVAPFQAEPLGKNGKQMFNGKCPSFLDANGKPRLIKHTQYKDKLPTDQQLAEWFENPANGIGTLANTSGISWIDLDRKNFDSQADCDNALAQILEKCPRTYHEKTRSGGAHIAIKLHEAKGFTNFKIGPDGQHAGEFLGAGRFCVLAPTSGYTARNGGAIASVQSATALGIYPTAAVTAAATVAKPLPAKKEPSAVSSTICLEKLISKKNGQLLAGTRPSGDFSRALTAFARECYGWSNFLNARNISHDSADALIESVAVLLEIGDKANRVLARVKPDDCTPGLERKKGIDACEALLKNRLEQSATGGGSTGKSNKDIAIGKEDTPGRVVWREIYENGQAHLTLGDEVYKFAGTHYEVVHAGKRRNEVAKLLDRCVKVTESDHGELSVSRPYSHDKSVSDALNFSKSLMPAAGWNEVNRAGVNCKNGVLCWRWEEGHLIKELLPHHPSRIFLSEPKVTYDPNADESHFNRLLEAIGPAHQSIVLRTLAASFDLSYVRSRQHRAVRILAMLGGGSNGKDALKDAMAAILSNEGVTSVPLIAFTLYDQGKQFGLASLAGSRINWPSENSFSGALDGIESLKALVTGETLQREIKNRQAEEFRPNCVPIFNGNAETLKLMLGNEAIASRYAVVPFSRTFKKYPDPNDPNEIEADPRFRDGSWLAENVCSAMLNRLMAELENVANEGIDYKPVEDIMQGHVLSSFHLAEFIQDSDLIESKGNRLSVSEIWEKLKEWYEREGILRTDENGREAWTADDRVGDKFYKSSRQMSAALVKFIPQATNKGPSARSKHERFIVNVAWASAATNGSTPTDSPIAQATATATPTVAEAVAYVEKHKLSRAEFVKYLAPFNTDDVFAANVSMKLSPEAIANLSK